MKRFNYTGTCIPEMHYIVNTDKKIEQIKNYIDMGDYFTINRPRQYGKSTSIYLLKKRLEMNYIVIKTSFSGIGETIFETEENFCTNILSQLAGNVVSNDDYFKNIIKEEDKNCSTFKLLSEAITRIIQKAEKRVVLFIDEVDKASNQNIFLNFLGMLRDKYLKRNEGEDYTFHSIVLAGVHDIKNIKMKMRDETETKYNSPWNIAIDFKVEMSFSPEEIGSMLIEYEKDYNTGMNVKLLSEKLYEYTSGYPYLVSKLCNIIDSQLNRDFTEQGLEDSMKIILNESNTLFDDLIKNINKYQELYELLEKIVLEGKEITYNTDAHIIGISYGIFKEGKNRKLTVHNKIFEMRLYNYIIAMREIKKDIALDYKYMDKFVDTTGNLNMELVLEKFQELMKAEYREADERFVEREGRLLFLAFIKPIINGTGFYFVEPETRMSNRMDVVVTFNKRKFVIELKIWRGGKYEQEGREQLCEYLSAQNLDKGYMVFYNFNKGKEYRIDRVELNEKEIFEVIV